MTHPRPRHHRPRRYPGLVAAAVVALSVALVVPAGASSPDRARAQSGGKCPVGAAKKASGKPVEVQFWHAMTRENETTLQQLTDEFNSSQSDVRVTLVNQVSYESLFDKYKAALGGGDLPDLVQLEDTSLQSAIDSQSVLPIAACVKADKYSLKDFIPRTIDYYTVEDTLYGMPFNVSNPVFYYNKQAFEKAGLDPDEPPTTLEGIKDASQAIVDAGVATSGYAIKLDPWYLEQWLAKAGKVYVNNGNGRSSRATAAAYDNATGVEIAAFLKDMVDSNLAINTGKPEGNVDNLLAIGADNAAMTIDSSASLGTITQVLGSGQFPNVTIGVAPMPGPVGKGGILVGGAALYITKDATPEKQDAAWQYIKFLVDPEQQATWAAGTGYVPIRESATELPAIQELWATQPFYKVAYDQLVTGVNNDATAGPVLGPYQGVRDIVIDQLTAMLTQGKSAKAAVKAAAQEGTTAIEDYNSRVGA
jgi:sn-glycerol 3-phosphate transport system substrate-binding protein